jgi:predicted SnoaL-like aldol condensation-catalyzing enzyme
MSTEQNKAVVRRFINTELNTFDAALVDELLAPDYVNHMVPGGREGFKQFIAMARSGLPGLKIHQSVERLIAEGDYVVARSDYRYSYAGKEASGSYLSEYRLANGKIVEDWPPSNAFELLQQIGVTLPTPAPAPK